MRLEGVTSTGLAVVISGYFADVVVFDPKTFRDTATFDKPHQYPTGVKWVFVNGHPAVADGRYEAGVLGARVIRFKSVQK